ncbi:ATP-binding cassette sub-family F member 3 [Labrus bergylta]|uniref:ATP-binding cassette sub-family F member 3 n=1 Tax=Labrus bergylta TaxID=56723 RepID=UPI0009B373FD|nr:ATP-binding cassette sub-family F member 3 isoform X1 [Labrus bergylta]XP_020512832.1 ATP-binding cassette sub-family F member 3 isoform X2 [Labrus bergylta]XP_029137808.1 ATP-binding cassette sub-family F member 3 isoform X3 [Labrus bergylta]
MATYVDILKSEFPEIDTELFDYITGVLDSGGADFEDGEEVYEAIGGVLQDVSADSKNEDDVRDICLQMFNTLQLNHHHSSQKQVLLDAPVQLSQISVDNVPAAEDVQGIWMLKRSQNTTVNAKKLEKAEAKLKAKHERRNEKDIQKGPSPLVLEEASASQASSKKDNRVDQSGKNRSYDIRIENFDVSFGERCLLQGAELSLATGRRYGLIGRNGLGKTTLLKMLASRNLRVPAHISILHVEQEVAGDETGALQSVLESDTLREELLSEEKRLNARIANGTAEGMESVRLSEIYAKLEEIDADKAPARASVILAGLGFSPRMQQQTTKEFSGGWRMRLALARALFARPDLLLLDEPTNMLDVRAILWLENYLQTWQSTILVVSHDRNFLNAVVTDIIHLHSQRLESYRGDYENFIKTKEDRLKNQQREYEAQLQYRQHIQVFIDRFRYNANRAAQVQSKLKLLERLPELQPLEKETEVTLRFPDNFEKLSPPILQLDEVEFYYSADLRLFSGLNLSADLESRICIVGENGAGKSTILKLLMGELTPVNGIRQAHRNLKIGYFSQHHVDQLDLNVCSVELLLNKFPGRTEEEYRHQLGGYGITGELSTRPVASLSGGQKSRVAFAQMTMPCPNFYILDEPTNHLDMETIEALAKALNKFKGGVILVSHDERLIRLVCKELWVCEAGKVARIDGGFDEYRDILQEQFRKEGYL